MGIDYAAGDIDVSWLRQNLSASGYSPTHVESTRHRRQKRSAFGAELSYPNDPLAIARLGYQESPGELRGGGRIHSQDRFPTASTRR